MSVRYSWLLLVFSSVFLLILSANLRNFKGKYVGSAQLQLRICFFVLSYLSFVVSCILKLYCAFTVRLHLLLGCYIFIVNSPFCDYIISLCILGFSC